MRAPRRHARAGACTVLLAGALLGAGCAGTPQTDAVLAAAPVPAPHAELTAVPFFPQSRYQCGPAALATLLGAAGAATTPEELVPDVYLPGRRGSLQLELVAAARARGFVPYVLEPRLEAVLAEVSAGTPVLVLQNLGLEAHPQWHFAVVVGFHLAAGDLVLRSGVEARRVVSMRVFEHTWRRGGHWAMVVMPAHRLPRTANENAYLRAVMALERAGRRQAAAAAYAAALERWPGSLVALMGLGNSRYALGDLPGAEAAYRRAVRAHPAAAAAFNNLAQTLAEQGRLGEAEAAARRAVVMGGPMRDVYEETLEEILHLAGAAVGG